jgi:hypothetical protein
MTQTSVERSTLHIGPELADGGQGKVFALSGEPTLVYKEYHDPGSPRMVPTALVDLISRAPQITVRGRPAHEWAAWPQTAVTDGGRLTGFLMPRVPREFTLVVGGRPRLADLSYLSRPPAPKWGEVDLPNDDVRVAILRHFAATMDALHARGLVIGDISFGNVLWRADPAGIMLIDCDGIHPEGEASVMPQADTLDWNDPAAAPGERPDRDRDRYKLSLAVARVLAQDLTVRPCEAARATLHAPEPIQQSVRPLLQQACSGGLRPDAARWVQALGGRTTISVAPPTPQQRDAPPPNPDLIVDGTRPRQHRTV